MTEEIVKFSIYNKNKSNMNQVMELDIRSVRVPHGFWLEENDGQVVLGLEESIRDTTGAFIDLKIPEAGVVITKDETVLTIQGTEEDVELRLPFSCVVAEVNQDVVESLHVSDRDWLLRLEKYQHE